MEIAQLIARRSDLGSFLIHLTRNRGDTPARERMRKILRGRKLRAFSPFGPAVAALKGAGLSTDSQRCVCFTETPLEHLPLLLEEIDGRECQFRPYGIAITKQQGRRLGCNPVWYQDITPGHDWLTGPTAKLIRAAIKKGDWESRAIAKLCPFIEQMGQGQRVGGGSYTKEFWWEREWRHVGDLMLPARVLLLAPEDEHSNLRRVLEEEEEDERLLAKFIDPRWSLERIIAHLAGFRKGDVDVL